MVFVLNNVSKDLNEDLFVFNAWNGFQIKKKVLIPNEDKNSVCIKIKFWVSPMSRGVKYIEPCE